MAPSSTVRVPLEFVKGTMRLARPISDAQERLVASAGTLLSDSVVRLLRGSAVQSVLVSTVADLPPWELVRPLAEELAALTRRIGREDAAPALATLGAAVERHIRARALQYEHEDALATGGTGPGAAR